MILIIWCSEIRWKCKNDVCAFNEKIVAQRLNLFSLPEFNISIWRTNVKIKKKGKVIFNEASVCIEFWCCANLMFKTKIWKVRHLTLLHFVHRCTQEEVAREFKWRDSTSIFVLYLVLLLKISSVFLSNKFPVLGEGGGGVDKISHSSLSWYKTELPRFAYIDRVRLNHQT